MRVAMVCMGNICRSPMAEHVLRRKAEQAGLDIEVVSAGTGGWHVGEPSHELTARVLSEHGYTNQHRAQQFKPNWFDNCDLILVMDHNNLQTVQGMAPNQTSAAKVRLLREFDSNAEAGAIVPDPYYEPYPAYLEVLAMVEAACDGVVNHLIKMQN